MKINFLYSLLVGTALTVLSVPVALADGTPAPAAPAAGSTAADGTGSPAGADGQHMDRLKAALDQLDLTDAQKDQIKQIRANVTDRRERRQQIMAVLTPDQQAKLKQMFQEHRNQMQAGTSPTTTPSAN